MAPNRFESTLDRSRMMCEVIIDSHAVWATPQFQAALDSLKRSDGIDTLLYRHANMMSRGNGRTGVTQIMVA
jgi:hypothetical protein